MLREFVLYADEKQSVVHKMSYTCSKKKKNKQGEKNE